MYLYGARNFSTLVGIASPEPMANMYSATYFRATWVLTALDAGFWTAMRIKRKWLREIASIVFSLYYLVAAEQADEKVRKVRGMLTVEHLRVSWNKGTTPILSFSQNLLRPRFMKWPPREIRVKRPKSSDYDEYVNGWLYWDGSRNELLTCNKVILDIPGGGFVAMNPRTNDDKLLSWASKTRIPVLSLDYKKAPEYPYPYALNECFDVYSAIMQSKGRCIGLSGEKSPHIIITGDSAGGNLAVAMTLMVLESGSTPSRRAQGQSQLPVPNGLVLFYPALDVNIGNWMSDEQMALINNRQDRGTNKSIARRKSAQYNDLVGTPHHSDNEEEDVLSGSDMKAKNSNKESNNKDGPKATIINEPVSSSAQESVHPEFSHALVESWNPSAQPSVQKNESSKISKSSSHRPKQLKTRLAMSSMISYFNDRVLTPELMRAMIILYIGPHSRPDFSTDYLLSPILAPDGLLSQFPKTVFLTGERDPLVDDTVIFAGRLRRAKREAHRRGSTRSHFRLESDDDDGFEPKDHVEMLLLPGISHGFLQFPTVFPPTWEIFDRAADWMLGIFRNEEIKERERERSLQRAHYRQARCVEPRRIQQQNGQYADNSTDDEKPLEMSMTKLSKKRTPPPGASPLPTNAHIENCDTNGGFSQEYVKEKKVAVFKAEPDIVIDDGNEYSSEYGENADEADDEIRRKRTKKKQMLSRVEHMTKDLQRLKSHDDLLSRRMTGIAGGLTKAADEDAD